jgi:hypothetical protein
MKTEEIRTQIIIQAAPEKVWMILTDFKNYPNWNSFIPRIEGQIKEGKRLIVKIQPPGKKGMIFKPTVTSKIENRELKWLGRLFIKGFFDGEHKFEIIDNNNGTVTFIQSEKFSGVLVRLFNFDTTEKGFEEMNKQLKKIAEIK